MSIQNPLKSKVHFTPITGIDIGMGGGANEWVDVGALSDYTIPVVADAVYVFITTSVNAQYAGMRPHGAATAPKGEINKSGTFLSEADAAGHCDAWRANSDNKYTCVGYFK